MDDIALIAVAFFAAVAGGVVVAGVWLQKHLKQARLERWRGSRAYLERANQAQSEEELDRLWNNEEGR